MALHALRVVFGSKEKVKKKKQNNTFSGVFLHVYILSAAAAWSSQVLEVNWKRSKKMPLTIAL